MEILGNLLENACKFSKGRVRAVAEPIAPGGAAFQGAGRMVITVDDNGAGLPADQRAEVLKRGSRLDESAPGSGLGLSIVDELARAYGGALTLEDSPMGGLRVVLELPRSEG